MPQPLRRLFTQDTSHGSRSTALQPLQWALGLLLASLTTAGVANGPPWLLALIAGGVAVVLVQLVFAYNFLLLRDRDALRSESYTLQKMAIEKGLIGDTSAGFVEVTASEPGAERTLRLGQAGAVEEEARGQ